MYSGADSRKCTFPPFRRFNRVEQKQKQAFFTDNLASPVARCFKTRRHSTFAFSHDRDVEICQIIPEAAAQVPESFPNIRASLFYHAGDPRTQPCHLNKSNNRGSKETGMALGVLSRDTFESR
jgi:hypothetical protein